MRDSYVLDASVVAAAYFQEAFTPEARAAIFKPVTFIAPDLLHVEMASLAAKKVRRGEAEDQATRQILGVFADHFSEFAPVEPLMFRAYELSIKHGVSAYDGAYLALAESRQAQVLTADIRLIRRARETGLGHLVQALNE